MRVFVGPRSNAVSWFRLVCRLTVAGAAPLICALLLARPAEALDGGSRLDPRLRSFKLRAEEARQAGLAPESIRSTARAMYPGTTVLSGGAGIGVECLILLESGGEAALRAAGIEPRSHAGNVVTATVPLSALDRLETMPGVRYVEMARALKPYLDVSGPTVKANLAHGASQPPYPAAPNGYTGRNVIVGLVDTGVDLTHGDFRNSNGTTRIERVWDQSDNSGTHPTGFGYGTEWTAAQINGGTASEVDDDGHGTHVLGIAAGNGSDTDPATSEPAYRYIGIAPEAPIIAVKTTFTTDAVLDGVTYIFNQATLSGRDAVVNLSLGTQDGPHDGTSVFDQGIGGLVTAGHLITAAAGNENNSGVHARVAMAAADSAIVTFNIPTYTANPGSLNDYVVIDGWFKGTDVLTFVIESPDGHRSQEILNRSSQALCMPGSAGRVYVENNKTDPSNGDKEFYVEVTDGTVAPTACGNPKIGVWKIIVYRRGTIVGPGYADFWVSAQALGSNQEAVTFILGVDNSHLVGSPASAPGVVSVGAFISKRMWISVTGPRQYVGITDADLGRVAPFSSPGPLRNEAVAPILSAPGMGIASAKSFNATYPANFTLTDNRHVINQGTSQASPHVAGAIALSLEGHPHETPAQILTRLTSSSLHDAFTGGGSGNFYGYGKLDSRAALDYVPIALSLLEAIGIEGGVRVRWTVSSDDPYLGFQVWRGPASDGPFTRITTALLTGGPEFSFVDHDAPAGVESWYRLEGIESDGSIKRFGPLKARPGYGPLELAQNGPNPFSGATSIHFNLPAAGQASLRVYDLAGRLVATLLDGERPAGAGEVTWDGTDLAGRPASNGIYFYRLTSREGTETRKMLLKR